MQRKIVFEAPWLKPRRQQLREKSTLAEEVLWRKIRNKKLGIKFIRQYSVEGYVIDFYCPEKRLGIELEGEIHELKDVQLYDNYRFKFIEAYNIKIIRFKNSQVLANINDVVKNIAISLS